MNEDINPTISDTELERSYWYVTHYRTLHIALIGILLVFSILLFGFVLSGILSTYILSSKTNEAFVHQITQQQAASTIPIQPIIILRSGSVESVEALRDTFVVIANRNEGWYARADLVIKGSADEELARKKIMLLPREERTFVALALPQSSSRSSAPILEHIRYARMSDSDREIEREKKDITASDIRFIPASESGSTRLIPITKLRFSVTNQTTSDFWEVRVPVLMKNGNKVQALHEAVFSELNAGQRKEVEVSWYSVLSEGDSFDVRPFVDILDPASYQQ